MVAAAGLSLLFTAFAYFGDTEASSVNRFQVGTWALEVNNGGGDTASHTFNNLIVGDDDTETWTVTNTGTIPAYVDLDIEVSASGIGNMGYFLLAYLYVSGGSR
jgi:hypothetical protein